MDGPPPTRTNRLADKRLPKGAQSKDQTPTGYGTVKLTGMTVEQIQAQIEAEGKKQEEEPKRVMRGTVEDIASKMQTSVRSQNKGKQSFWERSQEKKAEKERLKKTAKREKREEKKRAKETSKGRKFILFSDFSQLLSFKHQLLHQRKL